MKCRYCQEQMRKDETVCPFCGKDNAKISTWKIVLAAVCCFALVAVLAGVILNALGVFRDNDINYKDNYYASDKKVLNNADKVIATVNGKELTNRQFQIMYWTQAYEYNSYSVETFGAQAYDLTKPLNEQVANKDTGLTWQKQLINDTLETWYRYQLIMFLAEEEKFELSEDYRKLLADMPANLETYAKQEGFESAQAMLEEDFGAGCTVETYVEYFRVRYTVEAYLAAKKNALNPTTDALSKYYDDNETMFKNYGVLKTSARLKNVRHILVQLDNVATNDDMTVTYTDDQWALCKQEAEKIYAEWEEKDKDQEKLTEKTFAELAKKYSKDVGPTGEVEDGGLIENIYEGQTVTEFNEWIFADGRMSGDHTIVKTKFGYHIIYYVSDQFEWEDTVRARMEYDLTNKIVEDASARWSKEVNYKRIVLSDPNVV